MKPIFLLLIFLIVSVNDIDAKSKISVEINLNTNNFIEGQPVWVNVQFRNRTDKTVSISEISESDIYKSFIIKDEQGIKLKIKGLVRGIIQHHYASLKPKEIISFDVEVKDVFGNMEYAENENSFSPKRYFNKGIYTIQLIKKNGKERLKSKTLAFVVNDPPADEQANLEELKVIYLMPDSKEEEIKAKLSAFRNLFLNNKNSVYFDEAFRQYILMKAMTNTEYNEETANEIVYYLENNPGEFETKNLVWYFTDSSIKFSVGKSETKKVLEQLLEKYPKTVLAEGIEQTLRSHIFQ